MQTQLPATTEAKTQEAVADEKESSFTQMLAT